MSDSCASVEQAYQLARERYVSLGVDTEQALARLATIPISLHCWQGDDVVGFEQSGDDLGGGLAVTGNYPGKANTTDELRSDLELAYSLIPGKHRLNLHAIYRRVWFPRPPIATEIDTEHFTGWIDWAKEQQIGLGLQPHLLRPHLKRATASR